MYLCHRIRKYDKYEWNGIEYTESGDYVQTLIMANGCDSIVTLHLTITNATRLDAIESSGEEVQCTKILRDGQLFILRRGQLYDVVGKKIE